MAKIGLMGGTFDPIHNGHLLLGKQAYQEYALDEVWFMPSHTPPHKKDHRVTEISHRCAMVKLAIAEYPYFRYSDFEIRRGGNTYTAQTMKALAKACPQHEFYFIIGADSLYELETWYHPREILDHSIVLAAEREYDNASRTMDEQIEYLKERFQADIRRLHSQEVHISSQELRDMRAEGKRLSKCVPACVEQYIEANGLYQEHDKR